MSRRRAAQVKSGQATAKVFWSGRSQAVRLPKEFRLECETVHIRREGNALVIEPADQWPPGWVESFSGMPDDFERPPQGKLERPSIKLR